MSFIATLIAEDALTAGDCSAALDRLRDAGCVVEGWSWLEPGSAADLRFGSEFEMAGPALAGALPHGDIAVQPADRRRKALLVADMDSTMITVECIDELADYAGIKPQVAEITERAMRGELDFAAALDARVALLAGLDAGAIDRCLDERVTLMPGAIALIRTMRSAGATTILVSGGFTSFAEPVAARIGFDRAIANRLEVADGMLTGRVTRPIVDSSTKERTLRDGSTARSLDLSKTLAVGDGANDLAMMRAAGLGVAYHAKPIVAAEADVRIDCGDLSALLYVQGYRRAEWVTD